MKKRILIKRVATVLLCGMVALSTVACGKDKSADNSVSAEEKEMSKVNLVVPEGEIETSIGTVKLCDYSNLTVDETRYTFTDEDVESLSEGTLYDYIDYVEQTRGSQADDYLEAFIVGKVGNDIVFDYSETEYYIWLGYEEFGPEFDEQLTGVKAGEEKKFTISFDADYQNYEIDVDLAGKTVDFTVTVQAVLEEVIPEFNDEFVKTYLGYKNLTEYLADQKKMYEEEYLESSKDESKATLLSQIVENSEFISYDESILADCLETVKASYESFKDMFGMETVEELYEAFGIAEEDLEAEALSQLHERIVVEAIAKIHDLSVKEDEITAYCESEVEANLANGVVQTAEEYLAEVGEESVRYLLLENKVKSLIYSHATVNITTVGYSDETEDGEYYDLEAEDDGEESEDNGMIFESNVNAEDYDSEAEEEIEDEDYEEEDWEDEDYEIEEDEYTDEESDEDYEEDGDVEEDSEEDTEEEESDFDESTAEVVEDGEDGEDASDEGDTESEAAEDGEAAETAAQ